MQARQVKGKHINFYHFPTTDHWVSSSDQVPGAVLSSFILYLVISYYHFSRPQSFQVVLAVNYFTYLMSKGEVLLHLILPSPLLFCTVC